MFFITDDCGYDDGIRFDTIPEARIARKAVLNQIGHHMADWTHVAEDDTYSIVSEPGAWKTIDPETGEATFWSQDDDEKVDNMWDRGYLDVKPEWVPDYEWSV